MNSWGAKSNAMNVKISDETKKMLVELATFEESFWSLSDALTDKSKDEKIQEVHYNLADEEQTEARNAYYKACSEFESIIKKKMFQKLFDTDYREI